MKDTKIKKKHPYIEFENTLLWQTVGKAISNLESNLDIEIKTDDVYVIGYICQQLENNNVIKNSIAEL